MKRINNDINTKQYWELQWKHAPEIDWGDRRYHTMAHYVVDGDVVLDMGCGRGELGYIVKQIRPKSNVFGTDISETAIQFAKANFPGVTWELADAYKQPYKDGFFNTVLCGELIEHLSYPQKMINECFRVLKSGGRLVLSCPYKDSMIVPEHVWVFNGQDLVRLCKEFSQAWHMPWASGRRLVDVATGKETHPPGAFDILFVIAIK